MTSNILAYKPISSLAYKPNITLSITTLNCGATQIVNNGFNSPKFPFAKEGTKGDLLKMVLVTICDGIRRFGIFWLWPY